MGSDVVKRMVDAADAFLQALSTEQRSKAQLDFFDEAERKNWHYCLLYTSPSPRYKRQSRMPYSA